MTKEVKFKCPECGSEWVEEQDTEDEWFGLATKQTLCTECSRKAMERIRNNNAAKETQLLKVDDLVESLRDWEPGKTTDEKTKDLMTQAANTIQFYIETIKYIEEGRKCLI